MCATDSTEEQIILKNQIIIAACLSILASPTLAATSNSRKHHREMHHDVHRHYKGKDHMFRHGGHDNYNPHHRKCGYMPGGSC